MKLKKVVSLALAGVLALTMFSGCATGVTTGNITTDRSMYSKIVADLDEETTKNIKFTYSSSVAADLQKAAEKAGANILADDDAATTWAENIKKTLEDINADYKDTISASTDEKEVQKEQKQTTVYVAGGYGANETYVARKIAEEFDEVFENANLAEKSGNYGNGKYYYAYSYTAEMGVVEVKDAVTGQNFYGMVIVLHRIPTKTNNA